MVPARKQVRCRMGLNDSKFAELRAKYPRKSKAEYKALHAKAHAAGMAAAAKHEPVAMVVGEADGLSDRFKPGAKLYHVPGGVCGFAWVNVKPGNCGFAKWLTKTSRPGRPDMKLGRTSYYGGIDYSVSDFGQSMSTKEAYAHAYASVLNDAGIRAYAMSRMD